ncbi:protein translocase subunit SecD [Entomomonas asaccharolytica]|uniref:Protein translocase subunit SecD n=1 Tax=Entomomonas asaccharolytica TaxID=2785331 RepID=A0A974RY81_9GAMM|nr:protein translocase subunit SecD [Entomomonas asaccharolytica]QQP87018.1 protein translocase subunit SecD [Entomomonas asaccharolytica]
MLNKYPLWKYILILVVLAIGLLYSAPNLYPDDPAVQITGSNVNLVVDDATVTRVKQVLTDAKIETKSVAIEKEAVLIRLTKLASQLPAKAALQKALGDDYVVALNLAPTTPAWLTNIGARPMKLGLDLSGGVHFLLEVDMDRAIKTRLNMYDGEIRNLLREERIRYRSVPSKDSSIQFSFADEATAAKAEALITTKFNQFNITTATEEGAQILKLVMSPSIISDLSEYAVSQNLQTVRNRVNELGVAEPIVQQQGANRIVVELPGVQDTAEAKRILGKTANLEFRLAAKPDDPAISTEQFDFEGRTVALERSLIITGDQVSSAKVGFDQRNNQPQVEIELDGHGGDLMFKATQGNVGRSMAVIFIEQRPITHYVKEEGSDKEKAVQAYVEDRKIISLATIRDVLSSRFVISGSKSTKEASELALLLRAGGLAAPMHFVEERTLGPSLGEENIKMGINSTIWAMILIAIFMVIIYKFFGIIATVALAFNLVLLTGLLSIIGATLTLPGIAGIVLTLGMAIDANVLIYSRIREELNNGLSVQRAIHEGFDRAYTAIIDSNLTTLLVGAILFQMGTGPIKGFAVTLSLGIITSLFTAVMVTRGIVNLLFGGRNVKKLWI